MNLVQRIYRLVVNLKRRISRLSSVIIVCLTAVFCLNPSAYAERFHVDGSTGSDSDSGLTWPLAFLTVQKALAAAADEPNPPHEIWVAQGLYVPDVGPGQTAGDRDSTFDLVDKVEMYGGFFGDETLLSQRDPAVFITILSGDITDPYNGACGEGNGDCFADNGTPGCEDAACCATVCELDPICCLSDWDGGCAGIADGLCTGGEVPYGAFHVVTASSVDNTTRIDGFTITAGSAGGSANADAVGGGMIIEDSDLVVVTCIIANNFAGNALASDYGEGGGVDLTGDADVHFINCEFLENFGAEGGAMHVEDGSTDVTLVNCLFARNEATHHGGAIDDETDEPAELNIYNCTFVENIAPTEAPNIGGGAIWTQDPEAIGVDGPTVLITNCILWDNTPNQIDENAENPFTVRYTDIEGGWTGTGNINLAPTFGPGDDNYRLMNDSDGVDVGNNADVQCDAFDVDDNGEDCDAPAQDTPDLDLGVRIVSGTVDMGAYESVPCPWDLDGNCVVGVEDLLIILANWASPYDIDDFDDLLDAWGPCACDPEAVVPSLEDELDDACLTLLDWAEFVRVLRDPPSQAVLDNYLCWMIHYLDHCNQCVCLHSGLCPDDDPFI